MFSIIFAKNQQQDHWGVFYASENKTFWEVHGSKHDTSPCREINLSIVNCVSLKLLYIQWWCPHFTMHSFSFFSLQHFTMRLGFFNLFTSCFWFTANVVVTQSSAFIILEAMDSVFVEISKASSIPNKFLTRHYSSMPCLSNLAHYFLLFG